MVTLCKTQATVTFNEDYEVFFATDSYRGYGTMRMVSKGEQFLATVVLSSEYKTIRGQIHRTSSFTTQGQRVSGIPTHLITISGGNDSSVLSNQRVPETKDATTQ